MSVGPWQVILIAIVVLLLFGSKHLGTLGRMLGRGARNLRQVTRDANGEQAEWVRTAADVGRSANGVRKALKGGRLLR